MKQDFQLFKIISGRKESWRNRKLSLTIISKGKDRLSALETNPFAIQKKDEF